jgi:threonine/homoserine/homoserine lactone efflux protein
VLKHLNSAIWFKTTHLHARTLPPSKERGHVDDFLYALVFGFVFCLSPGAVLAETLRRGLQHGFRPALLVQVGSLVGDAVWAVIGLTGLALLIQHDAVRIPLTVVCALYLAWLGLRSLIDAWHLPESESAPASSQQNALAVGAAISLANPKNIVYWARWACTIRHRRRHAQPRADADVFCRFHAGFGAVVLSDSGAGQPAAPEHLAAVAARQLWRVRCGIDLSGGACRARDLNGRKPFPERAMPRR